MVCTLTAPAACTATSPAPPTAAPAVAMLLVLTAVTMTPRRASVTISVPARWMIVGVAPVRVRDRRRADRGHAVEIVRVAARRPGRGRRGQEVHRGPAGHPGELEGVAADVDHEVAAATGQAADRLPAGRVDDLLAIMEGVDAAQCDRVGVRVDVRGAELGIRGVLLRMVDRGGAAERPGIGDERGASGRAETCALFATQLFVFLSIVEMPPATPTATSPPMAMLPLTMFNVVVSSAWTATFAPAVAVTFAPM